MTNHAEQDNSPDSGKRARLAFALLAMKPMKTLFKTVFATAVLVLVLLMGLHNRTTVDFSLLPLLNQSYHGPVTIMYFLFFGAGILMGLVISMRSNRKEKAPESGSNSAPTAAAPRIRVEPPVGSRIS